MNKKLLALSLMALSYIALPANAFAALSAPTGSIDAQANLDTFPQLAVNLLFYVGMFLSVAFLMYGGIKWISSKGDREAVMSAKKTIVSAIIGLIVVLGAFTILNIVFKVTTGTGTQKGLFDVPTISTIH